MQQIQKHIQIGKTRAIITATTGVLWDGRWSYGLDVSDVPNFTVCT